MQHLAPITIGGQNWPCTFTILENDDMDFLLGLDMLKAHQAIIDLKEGVLRMGSVVVPFLAEKDIPLAHRADPDDKSASSDDVSTPSSASASSSAASTRTLPADAVDEEAKIRTLTEMGVPRDAAIQLLVASKGNLQLAVEMLMK